MNTSLEAMGFKRRREFSFHSFCAIDQDRGGDGFLCFEPKEERERERERTF